jgi:hypothetical protein
LIIKDIQIKGAGPIRPFAPPSKSGFHPLQRR